MSILIVKCDSNKLTNQIVARTGLLLTKINCTRNIEI
jgi:hypothetical protein